MRPERMGETVAQLDGFVNTGNSNYDSRYRDPNRDRDRNRRESKEFDPDPDSDFDFDFDCTDLESQAF